MQINITTKYNIGDILYLQQTNGGGLRKVIICYIAAIDLTLERDTTFLYTLNRVAVYNEDKYPYIAILEKELFGAVMYARCGNTWLTEKPPKKRKPLTPQTLRYWVKRNE